MPQQRHLPIPAIGWLILPVILLASQAVLAYRPAGHAAPGPAQKIVSKTPVVVRLAAVAQTRAAVLTTDQLPYARVLDRHVGVQVILQIIDKRIIHPSDYQHLRIFSGGFNTGAPLRALHHAFLQPRPLNEALRRSLKQAGELGFPMVLRFAPAPPKATAIRGLSGSFVVLYGGKIRTLRVKGLSARFGISPHSPVLNKWGVSIRTGPSKIINRRPFLPVFLSGPTGCFVSLAVLRKGRPINHGYISVLSGPGRYKILVPLTAAVNRSTSLVLRLKIHQRQCKVRFHFPVVPLP
jgi:hypothetical protein